MRIRLPDTIRLATAVALALAFAALASVSVYRKAETFQSLGFSARPAAGAGLLVTASEGPGIGLAEGDRVLLVDGADVPSAEVFRQITAEAESATLTVLRGDELLELEYSMPPASPDLGYLVLVAAGLVYLGVGLYAMVHGRRSPAGLFFTWCLASAAIFVLSFAPAAAPDGLDKTIFLTEEAARLLLPALTVHLFLVFPTPLIGTRRRWVPLLYAPSAALGLLQADLALAGGRYAFGRVTADAIARLDRLELALIAIGGLAAVASLAWQALRATDWEQRRQIQWIGVGLATGYLPFFGLYVVPQGLGLDWPGWTEIAAVFCLALVPLAFAWALLRFRLWDLEIMLRDGATYAATLLTGVVSFSVLHSLIERGLADGTDLTRNVTTFVAGLAVAGVLVPTQRAVRSGLERVRHRGAWGRRQALATLGRELMEERRLDILCRRLLDGLRSGLGVARLDLYLAEGPDLYAVETTARPLRVGLTEVDDSLWSERYERLPAPTSIPAGHSSSERWFAAGYRYAIPLVEHGEPIGLVVAGHRDDGLPLDSEDLGWLRQLADQATLAIENARLVSDLGDRLAEVERLQQLSEGILASSPAGIVVIDDDDRVVSANAAFLALGGDPNVNGRPIRDLLPLPGELSTVPTRVVDRRSGSERHLQVSMGLGSAGEHQRVLVVQDVTGLVSMEQALETKERLAALGMLAAGVAHEVNTPITGISSYTQMLLADTTDDDPRRGLLEKVERQTFRASRIVNNLLDLARENPAPGEPVDVTVAIDEAIETIEEKLRDAPVTVTWQSPARPIVALAGVTELQRVISNLLGNAVDAMLPAGGELSIATSQSGDRVSIVVSDTGCGMSEEQLAQIFKPFYSTKLGSGGTGLGLAISYQIVRRYGGELLAQSAVGEGSRFQILLPACQREATP